MLVEQLQTHLPAKAGADSLDDAVLAGGDGQAHLNDVTVVLDPEAV